MIPAKVSKRLKMTKGMKAATRLHTRAVPRRAEPPDEAPVSTPCIACIYCANSSFVVISFCGSFSR